jgi:hypothetical protein
MCSVFLRPRAASGATFTIVGKICVLARLGVHAYLHIDLLPIKNCPPTYVLFRRSARQQSISESANNLHIRTAKPLSSALASILLSIPSRLVRRPFLVRRVVQTSRQETVGIPRSVMRPQPSLAETMRPVQPYRNFIELHR